MVFSDIFRSLELFELQCKVFQLMKQCRHIFQPNDNKSDVLFSVLFSDVWGSASEKSLFGYE